MATIGGSATLTITEPELSKLMIAQERDAKEPSQWYVVKGDITGRFELDWNLASGVDASTLGTTVHFAVDANIADSASLGIDYALHAFDVAAHELLIAPDGSGNLQFTFPGD